MPLLDNIMRQSEMPLEWPAFSAHAWAPVHERGEKKAWEDIMAFTLKISTIEVQPDV